jgi:hypothetical protein
MVIAKKIHPQQPVMVFPGAVVRDGGDVKV